MQRLTRLCAGLLFLSLAGCGGYKVTFEVEEVINGTGDSRAPLEVDVLALHDAEVRKYPAIANGTIDSAQWFEGRAKNDQTYADIPPTRRYALRRASGSSVTGDTLVGSPLQGWRDTQQRSVSLPEIKPEGGVAMFVIYGNFTDKGTKLKTAPAIFRPKGKEIRLQVGRDRITLIDQK